MKYEKIYDRLMELRMNNPIWELLGLGSWDEDLLEKVEEVIDNLDEEPEIIATIDTTIKLEYPGKKKDLFFEFLDDKVTVQRVIGRKSTLEDLKEKKNTKKIAKEINQIREEFYKEEV